LSADEEAQMHAIRTLLQTLHVGEPTGTSRLTLYPLRRDQQRHPDYLTLDDAVGRGVLRVTEVSEGGSVPHLLVKNGGDEPVLILDGEELVGAKQNRIVNLTILVPGNTTLTIPVSCVEAGRWRARSHAFAAAGRVHYAQARRNKLRQVTRSMEACGDRRADQGDIWRDIDEKAARFGAFSETSAAAAMYDKVRLELDVVQRSVTAAPADVGAIFVVNGRVAGLEVVDCQATWGTSLQKIVQSYGLDAIDGGPCDRVDASADPGGFLDRLASTGGQEFAAIGLGRDLRFEGSGIAGAALLLDDRVVHLVAFAQ
jgi:hypothetical protein